METIAPIKACISELYVTCGRQPIAFLHTHLHLNLNLNLIKRMPESSKVRSLFDDLSPNYDLYNRLFSLGLDRLWRRGLVQAVRRAHSREILDVACGSGDVALALQRAIPDANVTGLDFSAPLLAKAKARGVRHTVEGDALHLPWESAHFDAVTLAFGLRNFSDRKQGLHEIARVLRPGGTFALLEFSPPPLPWRIFWDFYLFYFMPAVAQLLTRQGDSFRYLARSIAEFPPPSGLHRELSASGFKLLYARTFSARLVRLTVCRQG